MKELSEQIKAYLKLLRVGNLAFLAILLYVMERWVAVPLLHSEMLAEQMPWWVLVVLVLSVVLIAAGGYVINDYFDVKIDRINRPDDLVVTRVIARETALHLAQVLSGIGVVTGLVVAWWAHSWTLLFCYLVIPGLLWFYSSSYKRLLLVGNLVVAFVSAIVPLLVAIAHADSLRYAYGAALAYTPIVGQLYVWLGGFAAFAFLLTWAREAVKDIQDIEGDRELECRTMPIVWGVKWTKIVVSIILLLTVALIGYVVLNVLPFELDWQLMSTRYVIFGLLVPLVCSIVLLWAAQSTVEYQRAQLIIKFAMFMGVMYSFVIHQNLL